MELFESMIIEYSMFSIVPFIIQNYILKKISITLLGSSVLSGRPYYYSIVSFSLFVIFFFPYKFCVGDFSKIARSLSFKFRRMLSRYMTFVPLRQFVFII